VDTTNPTADAQAILFSEHTPPHPAAIRHGTDRFRSVFSTIRQAAFSETAPAPNNNQTLVGRIVQWLTFTDISATPVPTAAERDRILDVYPNPAARSPEVAFTIPSDAGDVRLVVIDAAGRVVRTLAAGQFPEGRHQRAWDGKDSVGRPAGSGVYFVQLRTRAGQSSRKLVILE
jgi:flagellar hook assembly protein FlgD